MEPPPPPPPLPPRSRAEGREGSAPRQDPPLRPPPATSTPSLAPSLALRALPRNGSESAKEGKTGKYPPARVGRSGGRGGAEERGAAAAAAATGHRPRLGLTVAVRPRPGAEPKRGLRAPQPRVTRALRRRHWGAEAGTLGCRRASLTRVGRLPHPVWPRGVGAVWGSSPPSGVSRAPGQSVKSSPSVVSRGAGACTSPRKSPPARTEDKGPGDVRPLPPQWGQPGKTCPRCLQMLDERQPEAAEVLRVAPVPRSWRRRLACLKPHAPVFADVCAGRVDKPPLSRKTSDVF
nr:WAS/WASL-interacting protein family member 3-like [Desmodus rotundus]